MENPIPQHVVTELLGQVAFTHGEDDVNIAEQIASNTYFSMETLCSTISGEIRVLKYRKDWERDKAYLKDSPFFSPYFKSHP